MKFITHQGDIPIFEVPEESVKHLNFKEVKEQVVAEGEATGHFHKVVKVKERTKLEVAHDGVGYYLKVSGGDGNMTHQEHGMQVLTPRKGMVYYFGGQEEYDPITYRRKVLD